MSTQSSSFKHYLRLECRNLLSDKWLFSMVTWVPIVLFVILWQLFSSGVCRDLPVGVVDLDKSVLSRQFIRSYDATPLMKTESYDDLAQGVAALRGGDIYALVVLPAKLARDTGRHLQPRITAFVNYEYLLTGKQINSALQRAHITTAVRLDVGRKLASSTPVFQVATATAMPVSAQVTALANRNLNYSQFLVTAMVPAAWQIIVVASMILSLAVTKRRGGIEEWLAGGGLVKKMVAKVLPLAMLCWLQGLLFISVMFEGIAWPMHGSWSILAAALLLTTFACQGAGCLFYFVTKDATRAMSITAAYTAPGFAFMGVTFPVSNMNIAAHIWRSLLPISHYSEIQIGQASYGVSFVEALPAFVSLGCLGIFWLMALYLASRMVGVQPAKTVQVVS